MEQTAPARVFSRTTVIIIVLGVIGIVLFSDVPVNLFTVAWQHLTVFATVFLSIFIEALPFLMLGTLASGLVEVYLTPEHMQRWLPRRALPAALVGALLGMVFPVCECGVVPLTRRIFRKGLPLSTGVSFLLAAPVINPIVIFSTAAAFGWGRMLFWRVGMSFVIAVAAGLIFAAEKNPASILSIPLATIDPALELPLAASAETRIEKIRRALLISADDFFDMGRYLVIGGALAGAVQSFVPQAALLAIGNGPVTSVLVMLALAVLLSICSTVDAFVALGFSGTFSFGAVLSFLVFGPMVDIKSTLMYLQVFRRRPVAYLVLLPFLMSLLLGLLMNYFGT